MKLSIDGIDHIATMARLDLTDEEKAMYAEQLSAVLDYVGMLSEVDTSEVIETCQVTGLQDVVREDLVIESDELTRERLIEQFPHKVGKLLKVRAVFE